jgi:hypothetical protein
MKGVAQAFALIGGDDRRRGLPEIFERRRRQSGQYQGNNQGRPEEEEWTV